MSDKLKAIQDKVAKKKSSAHAELLHKDENEKMQEYENKQIHNQENEGIHKTANKKRATFELDEDFHTELKLFATRNRTKMIDVVTAAVRKYMDENNRT